MPQNFLGFQEPPSFGATSSTDHSNWPPQKNLRTSTGTNKAPNSNIPAGQHEAVLISSLRSTPSSSIFCRSQYRETQTLQTTRRYSPARRWASPNASGGQWTLTSFISCSFYSQSTVFYWFPRQLCPKQGPNTKAFDNINSLKSLQHYIQIMATWSTTRSTTNHTNFQTFFLGLRRPSKTSGRRNYKGKELSRNNYIHLPIPIYLSLWQIPSPWVWRPRH